MQMRPWQPCENVNEYFVFLNKSKCLKEENTFNTNKYDRNVLGNDAELFLLLYMYHTLFYQKVQSRFIGKDSISYILRKTYSV